MGRFSEKFVFPSSNEFWIDFCFFLVALLISVLLLFYVYVLKCSVKLTALALKSELKKSRIRETSNLSTDADCRTDTILESLRDLSRRRRRKKLGG